MHIDSEFLTNSGGVLYRRTLEKSIAEMDFDAQTYYSKSTKGKIQPFSLPLHPKKSLTAAGNFSKAEHKKSVSELYLSETGILQEC